MTHGTSHLLIGGGVFRGGGGGGVKKKYCCVRGGSLHENQEYRGGVLSTQAVQQRKPQCKNAQKCKKMIKH